MVLMNGSKRARNSASIVNQTNTCGGVGKSGLPPSVGRRGGREGGIAARAIPKPLSFACPAYPGTYNPSLNAVNNGPVGANRNSRFLYTKHISPNVPNNKVFYIAVQENALAGGVGKSRNYLGRFRPTV